MELESRIFSKDGVWNTRSYEKCNDEIGGGKIARDRKARIDRLPVQQELIVVPPKAGADCPISQMDQILHKCGLLEVWTICQESQRWGACRDQIGLDR